MAEHALDALVVRAPDNVLYLTNFWGMKGYDAVRLPARGRAGADLPRGLRGGRRAHRLDAGRPLRARATTPATPGRCWRARSTRRSRPRAATAASASSSRSGTQASDRMVGEPTTFTKAWFDAFPGGADATPLLERARAIKTAQEIELDADRERDRRGRHGARPRQLAARDEGGAGGGALAGLRARRRAPAGATTSSWRCRSRSSGRAAGSRRSPRPATCR